MSQMPDPAPADIPAPRASAARGGTRGRLFSRPATARLPRPSRWIVVLWCLALGVVVVDQLTKAWAVTVLRGAGRIDLLGHWLGLVLVRNPGAAFSFATGQTWVFTAVAVVVTVIVLRVSRRLGSMWWAVTLGLVLGGAVGNLIDRLAREPGIFRGHVVDFIDYGGLFVGNVADIAIVGAAAAIMALSAAGFEIDGSRAGDHDPDGTDEQEVDDAPAGGDGRDGPPSAATAADASAGTAADGAPTTVGAAGPEDEAARDERP
ncbi:signal peptidase II [Actinomyces israelii]|uniref:Lipoprotein signal peptidase n=1 Tax=Actinomyces israelii TaxID=1659 RepID=A0ABT4I7X1_9ACTO|nr:signal peptidase II [Actinomyces israelii]MCZ0857849.1 signal peptidase II [Actinomyces israelii]